MDGGRLDDLARLLASRRTVLGGLAGLAAGLIAARVGQAACGPDQVDRRGVGCVCATTGRAPGADGLCPCRAGLTRCGDACVDTRRDSAHCGACGHDCAAGATNAAVACRGGVCEIAGCAAGYADCDGDAATGCETELGTETDCGA